jgi:glyoxylase-like metal-dependent hydrolase (beta-lactamase superfamily II)
MQPPCKGTLDDSGTGMTKPFERRRFLQAIATSGMAYALSPLGISRAATRRMPLTSSLLTNGLRLITGAGGNIVVGNDAEGALMVDGGTAERAAEVLQLVRHETRAKRIHTLINTHWHPDQTGSNERLGKAGATIIAHENTRLWLTVAAPLVGLTGTYGPLKAAGLPNATTYSTGTVELGSEHVSYGYLLQAHTDGDLYVHFANANVLVAGDVVCNDGWPIVDWRTGGWISGMVNGLSKLVAISDAQTRIVPGRGRVLSRAELEVQRDMYATLYRRLEDLMLQGKGPDEAVAAKPTAGFDEGRGDPTQFVTLAFQSIWGHLAPNA